MTDRHQRKRLHHSSSSHEHHASVPGDETTRESLQTLAVLQNKKSTHSRTFEPAPNRARRGGARGSHRAFHATTSLPRRTINYDLAESFVDHSTNPLVSDLYQVHFKHSVKQWPRGRFVNYKEKIDKGDGNIGELGCTNTFDTVAKRKQPEDHDSSTLASSSLASMVDLVTQEQKKKLADKQTNVYNHLFGIGKIPKLSSTIQMKKTNTITVAKDSTTSNSLMSENKEDQHS